MRLPRFFRCPPTPVGIIVVVVIMKTTKARSVWPLLLWAELLVLGKPIVFSFLPAERKAIKSDSTFRFPSPPSPEEFVVIIVVVLLHSRSVGGILK